MYFSHDTFARLTSDGAAGTTIGYNYLDLPQKVMSGSGTLVKYSYLADGSKREAVNGSGGGLAYKGSLIYRKASGGALTLEGANVPEGRLLPGGVRYHVQDHLGSVRAVMDGVSGGLYAVTDYDLYGSSSAHSGASPYLGTAPSGETFRYHFTGKEDQGVEFTAPYTDFGARHYAPTLRRWLVPDPMSEKYYGISPYAYCAGDPVNKVDILGQRDTTFRYGIDLHVSDFQGTETPLFFGGRPNTNAYNCHSFAWEESNGDPEDSRNEDLVIYGILKWDNNPDNNMGDFKQLDFNTPNRRGDRVLYYVDDNNNGVFDSGEEIVHSAVVWDVDDQGYTRTVISKRGQLGISINHPQDPYFYPHSKGYVTGPKTSRAYFRYCGSGNEPKVVLPNYIKIK